MTQRYRRSRFQISSGV